MRNFFPLALMLLLEASAFGFSQASPFAVNFDDNSETCVVLRSLTLSKRAPFYTEYFAETVGSLPANLTIRHSKISTLKLTAGGTYCLESAVDEPFFVVTREIVTEAR